MKKAIIFTTIISLAGFFGACSSTKNNQVSYKAKGSGNPFGDVYEVPAAEHDTDDYFGATGIAYGNAANMDILQLDALTNAQNAVRQKMKHAYKGLISDYANSMNSGSGYGVESKVERGGDQVIDVIVNDTQATKGPMFSSVDDKGNVTCYVGIRVSKKVVAEAISDYLSEDQELKLRFDEEQFRKRMDETFRKYKEN